MHEMRQNLLVGLFVLVGLGVLGVLVVLFGRGPTQMLGGPGYPLHIVFDTAGGVREGNPVTLAGIRVGRIDSISFVSTERFDQGVRVTAIIRDEYRGKIPQGSTAVTTEPGLGLGRPPIEIVPGDPRLGHLQPDAEIRGTMRRAVDAIVPEDIRFTFDRTAAQVGEAAAALRPVLDDLHEILVKRTPGDVDRPDGPPGNLASAAVRIDSALGHFNEVLGDPQVKSHLREAVANFHAVSEDARQMTADLQTGVKEAKEVVSSARLLMESTQNAVERIDAEVVSVSRSARTVLEQASDGLGLLNETLGRIARGEGSLGRLSQDPKLYEALLLTVDRLAVTVEEVRLLVKEWQKGRIRVAL
jgi:phospholipid/cholesterol/gamma-HCH transport system substrate-binding protein